jgi:hypothetical protein
MISFYVVIAVTSRKMNTLSRRSLPRLIAHELSPHDSYENEFQFTQFTRGLEQNDTT